MSDLIIRGGDVVTPEGILRADIAIDEGRVSAIDEQLPGGSDEIDATGLTILPGLIDVHLHFNEPGRTEWEGAATGSRALAAGGGTLFFDMPLNSTPCTLNAGEFDRKRDALSAASITDFALWGGLVPGTVPEMAELAERGVVGFKAFMCDSGLPEFPRADDMTLLDGMREAARFGLPIAVHAESDELTRAYAARAFTAREGTDVAPHSTPREGAAVARAFTARDFLDSRPVLCELEAIQRALLFAEETGARLHIVHVSTGRGVALAAEARTRGVDVSIETCPHYLFFTEDDLERLGTIAKCAPPLRSDDEREALWQHLLQGTIDIVASDHSPTEPARKAGDFAAAWGGIAGVQSTMPVLLDRGYHARGLPVERIAALVATTPAERFGIKGKGAIGVGNDADFALVDLNATFTLATGHLQQRHKTSPYVGEAFRGRVRQTIRRGKTIYRHGAITASGGGQFVRPGKRN